MVPERVTLRKLRLKAVWLIAVPFFLFSGPTVGSVTVGAMLAAPGLWIRGWSAGTIHKDEELTTAGPYAFTRNPLYVGSLLIGVGVALAGGHWVWPTIFLLFYLAAYSRTMAHESTRLTELFGDEYREYAAHVPAFLPRATPHRTTSPGGEGGFRWSQYERNREWEALLGALAAFGVLLLRSFWAG